MSTLARTVNCTECDGGYIPYKNYKVRCPYCEGSGKLTFINFTSTPLSFMDRLVYWAHIKLVDPSEHVLFKWKLSQLYLHSNEKLHTLIHQAYLKVVAEKRRSRDPEYQLEEVAIDTPIVEPSESTIQFNGTGNIEILRLEPNGDIFVHGRLAENNKEVVDGLRKFLLNHGY